MLQLVLANKHHIGGVNSLLCCGVLKGLINCMGKCSVLVLQLAVALLSLLEDLLQLLILALHLLDLELALLSFLVFL